MDVMTPRQRYKAMSRNRGRTKPERALASELWRRGIRFLTHDGYQSVTGEQLPGRPDLVFSRKRLALFVDGCFWHGCSKCGKHSGLREQRWIAKIAANRNRDQRTSTKLKDMGWTVLRVPEHDIRSKAALTQTTDRLMRILRPAPPDSSRKMIRDFVLRRGPAAPVHRTAVSLFSGAGLSDLGYQLAGFGFVVQVEIDEKRASIGADNFPSSTWLTRDVRESGSEIAEAYTRATSQELDLLVATPPCQGMSSANPSRGKRQTPEAKAHDGKNRLLLDVIPVAEILKPRIIVAENVRQVLTLQVEHEGVKAHLVDHLRAGLPEYQVHHHVVNVADYGVPQIRKRALVVAVRKDDPNVKPIVSGSVPLWPQPTHAEQPRDGLRPWVTIQDWLETMQYERLDAGSKDVAHGSDPLHFVPAYGPDRYQQVSEIPPYSGRSAYQNDTCPSCGEQGVDFGSIKCTSCEGVMFNRPFVERNGDIALIKGFDSSYRRMSPSRPAYTITTNSSHVGSDYKIHPWENRVLSILECADIQTVPRFYDWTRARRDRTTYLIRNLVGEAFPTYFTYLHGRLLDEILSGFET